MFRLPKTSNQSSAKKTSNLVVSTVVSTPKNEGFCKYSHRKCNFLCFENYDYCWKHILEDKSAPYKPCPFLYTVSGKKCGKPALRSDRKDAWFCAEHNRKSQIQKQRSTNRHAPPKTQEALFATLGHYVPPEQPPVKKEDVESEESSGKEDSQAVNPFVDIDASQVNAHVSDVLDYVSGSDSDVDAAMLDSVWRAQDLESSDAESVDSQNEDPLKHAGTYTAEEVTIIIKDKMLRLQSLYIDQFRRLHHLLKEKRRKYLHAGTYTAEEVTIIIKDKMLRLQSLYIDQFRRLHHLLKEKRRKYLRVLKKEKESLCSIHDQEKLTAREQKGYQKLKALNRYHKHYGVEAILHKKALERRAQVTEGHQLRTSHKGKCAFTEGGVKCGAKTLPVTKYCRKHILEDVHQVLFRSCGVKRDDHVCREPTLNVFEKATCVYHTTLPPQPHDRLGKSEPNENRISNTQTTQNNSENCFVNIINSQGLLMTDILKPSISSSSGKPEPVDALELSRTVNDILSLTEDHPTSTETPDKPIIDHIIEPSSSGTSRETNNTSSEKMDVEEEQKLSVPPNEKSEKQESSEELVMVDMMTDVGVVEEVLEADQTVVSSVEEVVCSEQEVGGCEQKVEGSGQEPNENVEESMQMDTENGNKPENG